MVSKAKKVKINVGQTWSMRQPDGDVELRVVRVEKDDDGITQVRCKTDTGETFSVPYETMRDDTESFTHLRDRSALVFKYGLLAPTECAEEVYSQMRSALEYRNALIGAECSRRAGARELDRGVECLTKMQADLSEAKAELATARDAVSRARSAKRTGRVPEELNEAVAKAKARQREATDALRIEREKPKTAKAFEALAPAKKQLAEEAKQAGIEFYKKSPLWWGARALADKAAKASFESLPLYFRGEPLDPKHRSMQNGASLGVQVHQKGSGGAGFTVDEVMTGSGGASSWLMIGPVVERQLPPAKNDRVLAARSRNKARREAAIANGGGSKRELRTLRMRIGSREDGTPIIAEWPMVMHRPLPPGAIVRRVAVSVRRIGPREEWSVTLTLDASTITRYEPSPDRKGTVAISPSWKSVPGGIRIASWVDEYGDAEHITISDSAGTVNAAGRRRNTGLVAALRKAAELRSIRDENFNRARAELVSNLKGKRLPEWMRARTVDRGEPVPSSAKALAYIGQWRSARRMAMLVRHWRESRFDGDEQAFEAAESWRYDDYHLWRWEMSQRKSAERRRRDVYRVLAAELAEKYERIVMTDEKYSDMARRPEAEEGLQNDAAAANRHIVAPGDLRLLIGQAARKRACSFELIRASGVAMTCPAPKCGASHVAQKDVSEHQFVCTKCTFQRDLSTARCMNMLRAVGLGEQVDAMIERGRELGRALRMARDEGGGDQ